MSEQTVALETVRKQVGPLWTSGICKWLSVFNSATHKLDKGVLESENSLWSSFKRQIILQVI